MNNKYHFFWGGPFSNWYPAEIEYKGHKFPTTEHAFMWEKALTFGDAETAAKILVAPTPNDAKKLGRQVKNFNSESWTAVGFEVMVLVNLAKFTQHQNLNYLIRKNNNYVEASPYDKIWGIGMGIEHPDINDESKWKGQNLLGKALDRVQYEIKSTANEC